MKSRALGHWVKLKPEYGESVSPLDVAVVGVYYGEGRGFRGQGYSVVLCAVRDSECEDLFIPFCKVGSGLSFQALSELRLIDESLLRVFI